MAADGQCAPTSSARWPAALASLVLLLVASLLWWRNPWLPERTELQALTSAPTAPLGEHVLEQTLLAPDPQLKAVEFLVVADATWLPPSGSQITLTISADGASAPLAQVSREATGLAHNAHLRFDFTPLAAPASAPLRLTLRGSPGLNLALWSSPVEAYAGGELRVDGRPAGDLTMTVYSEYSLHQALNDVIRLAWRDAWAWLALTALLLLPGLAIVLWASPAGQWDWAEALGLALLFSLAVWALALLWGDTLGLRLGRWTVVAVLALAAGIIGWRLKPRRGRAAPLRPVPLGPALTLGVILALGFATRLMQARHLVAPNWVDGYHHTVLAQLIAETGALPTTGAPYVDLGHFHYHFGFHAAAATLTWLGGWEPYRAVLLLGQALNTLAALSAYTLASVTSRRPWAAVGAAAVAAGISYMPAYYLSWGRYTQLAGLAMAGPLMALTWRAQALTGPAQRAKPETGFRSPTREAWPSGPGTLAQGPFQARRLWLLVALGAAGLGLTHYRVLALYALFAVAALPWAPRARWRPALGLLGAGMLALLLVAPWALHMARVLSVVVPDVYGGLAMPEGVEDPLPISLLSYGWTPGILVAAAVGWLWACLRRERALIAVGLWCGLAVALANPQWLGLKPGWFLGNTPVAISYWLPAATLAGWLGAELARLAAAGLRQMHVGPWGDHTVHMALGFALVALTAWGGWRMANIVNPVTVLAQPEDLRAMAWAREHLPTDARVLINTRPWMNAVRMGADGAWWLPLLGGRTASLPCALYTQGPRPYREALQALAGAVEAEPELTDAALLARLRAADITHVMLGARGSGPMSPATLDGNPRCRELYRDGAVRIYALDASAP